MWSATSLTGERAVGLAAEPTRVKALGNAQRLLDDVRTVLERDPNLDPDTVRHTLALLRLDPLARLNRSLIRGRLAVYRA